MLAAAKPIAIARDPAVQFVRQRSNEWNLENARDESSARQHRQQPLNGVSALPSLTARTNQLNRFGECALGNPGESLHHPGSLKCHDFDPAFSIPLTHRVGGSVAHPTHAVIDESVGSAHADQRSCPSGLLLCEAMQRAKSPHEIHCVNADDLAIGQ
jgi:hypothetical protein